MKANSTRHGRHCLVLYEEGFDASPPECVIDRGGSGHAEQEFDAGNVEWGRLENHAGVPEGPGIATVRLVPVRLERARRSRPSFGHDDPSELLQLRQDCRDLAIGEVLQNLADQTKVALGNLFGTNVDAPE